MDAERSVCITDEKSESAPPNCEGSSNPATRPYEEDIESLTDSADDRRVYRMTGREDGLVGKYDI